MKPQLAMPLVVSAILLAATAPAAPPNVVVVLSDDVADVDRLAASPQALLLSPEIGS